MGRGEQRFCDGLHHHELERTDSILLTCVERRGAALSGMGWSVKPNAATDPATAERQKAAAEKFLSAIENFDEALEHLSLAFFRGFSFVQPHWLTSTKVEHIELLPGWAFALSEEGIYQLNPDASTDPATWQSLDDLRLVGVTRPRAIDYPALSIYIRSALAESDWGRFVERYGLPPVDVVMSDTATNENRSEYLQGANAAQDGQTVVWPSGSTVSRADSTRSIDPFSDFIRHQQELVVLMATGGKLTSLSEAGSGTLAGNAQMDVWREIVSHDARLISSAINRQLLIPFLEEAFPGEKVAVYFDLGTKAQPSAAELLDFATKARSAGYTMAQADLEEGTGYSFDPAPDSATGGMLPMMNSDSIAYENITAEGDEVVKPHLATDHDTDISADISTNPGSGAATRAFAADLAPATEKLARLSEMSDEEQQAYAAEVLKFLEQFEPEGTELADLMELTMASAIATETVENSKSVQCPKCGRWASDDAGPCGKCGHTPTKDEQLKATTQKLRKVLEEGKCEDIRGVAYRKELGVIDLKRGKRGQGAGMEHGEGLSKMLQKHPEDLPHLAETLTKGEVLPTFIGRKSEKGISTDKVILHGDYICVVTPKKDGKRWEIMTFYRNPDYARRYREQAAEIKKSLRKSKDS